MAEELYYWNFEFSLEAASFKGAVMVYVGFLAFESAILLQRKFNENSINIHRNLTFLYASLIEMFFPSVEDATNWS